MLMVSVIRDGFSCLNPAWLLFKVAYILMFACTGNAPEPTLSMGPPLNIISFL